MVIRGDYLYLVGVEVVIDLCQKIKGTVGRTEYLSDHKYFTYRTPSIVDVPYLKSAVLVISFGS